MVLLLGRELAASVTAFSVNVSKTGPGQGQVTKSPDKASYNYGDSVVLSATADPGSRFVQWSGDLGQQDWWDSKYDFRVPITARADGYQRFDKTVEVDLNFTTLLSSLGSTAPFEPDSLRLVEVNGDGVVQDANVPFQFDEGPGFDLNSKAAGTLVFVLSGTTGSTAERRYMLYFDVAGESFTPPAVTPQVQLQDGVQDEGQASLKITTSAATYYFHKNGGGFSSVDDVDGKDWVNFSSAPKSAGDFRGIPNLVYTPGGGYFHPGRDVGTTAVLSTGPLKATFRTKITGQDWQTLWTIYPNYATLTVEKAAGKYWFLYEGTPGGKLDPASDMVVRSDGTSTPASDAWEADLAGDEWVYFTDAAQNRSLFVAHHEGDSAPDSYRLQQDDLSNPDAAMTVFGFGRMKKTQPEMFLTGTPRHFTFGLLQGTGFSANSNRILSAVKPLTVSHGSPEQRQSATESATNPLNLRVTGDHNISATFALEGYTLTVNKTGKGEVTKTPDKLTYQFGETVTLEAVPEQGWRFAGWDGNLGTDPAITLTMNGDRAVMATFEREEYTLTVEVVGEGEVVIDPEKEFYLYGEKVNLTAVPADEWRFAGWSGDLTGLNPEKRLTIKGNQTIIATFRAEEERTYLPFTIGK